MLNKIVTDSDLGVELVINIQEPRTFDNLWQNSIVVQIDADDAASQRLDVDGGDAGTTSYTITSGQVNDIEIEDTYWNMGGDTTVTLYKGGSSYGTLTFTFPDQIDSLVMLNQDENDNTHYTMTGSFNDPSDIAQEVSDVSEKVEDLQSNKQNFINHDLLPPTGSGTEGDIVIANPSGVSYQNLYRNEGGSWQVINLFDGHFVISTTDIGEGVALSDGIFYLVVE